MELNHVARESPGRTSNIGDSFGKNRCHEYRQCAQGTALIITPYDRALRQSLITFLDQSHGKMRTFCRPSHAAG
jgi:hypothetical protein